MPSSSEVCLLGGNWSRLKIQRQISCSPDLQINSRLIAAMSCHLLTTSEMDAGSSACRTLMEAFGIMLNNLNSETTEAGAKSICTTIRIQKLSVAHRWK